MKKKLTAGRQAVFRESDLEVLFSRLGLGLSRVLEGQGLDIGNVPPSCVLRITYCINLSLLPVITEVSSQYPGRT